MKNFKRVFWLVGTVAAIALIPRTTMADTKITVYSQAQDGITDAFSSDFNTQGGLSPGATYVQASDLYLTANRTGSSVGTVYIACFELLNVFDVECMATFKFTDGALKFGDRGHAVNNSINVQGFYSEEDELLNCQPIVNVLAISGGTGALQCSQGQVTITHTPVNPTGPNCAHTKHNYQFDLVLL